MVMDCIIIQEVKRNFILSKRKICNISLRFIIHIILHGYGLHYNTRSKRVNEKIILCFTVQEEDQFLCKNFRFIVHIVYLLHGCGLHYNVLSVLSIKQEVKG